MVKDRDPPAAFFFCSEWIPSTVPNSHMLFFFQTCNRVTSAYALAYGAFLLIGGRLGDLFGHRRIYILGVTWFSIWAVVNGFAKDPIVMSVGRALQGMGAGFTVPSALAILTTTYPVGPERTQALAVFGGTGAVGKCHDVFFVVNYDPQKHDKRATQNYVGLSR